MVRRQGDEQAQKMRDLHRAKHHFNQVRDEVSTKQIEIEDHRKKDQDMQTRSVRLLICTVLAIRKGVKTA